MSQRMATVEVLTAEVRVLMVGSRQVTLSVFRQLDWVGPEEIEPFGRVRDPRDGYVEEVTVVGRGRNGQLVASRREWRGFSAAKQHALWCAEYDKNDTADASKKAAKLLQVYEMAAPWRALPLIVLAGLT